jgi:hypothetical protein
MSSSSSFKQYNTSPLFLSSDEQWTLWIAAHTAVQSLVPADYGLGQIASHLGPRQVAAHQLAVEGADAEADGDIQAATQKYATAYRQWPSLDSCIAAGIPIDVRIEAVRAGYLDRPGNVLLDVVDVQRARESSAVCSSKRVLSDADILVLDEIQKHIHHKQPPLVNNPENLRHCNKQACMMNNPPDYTLQSQAPSIVGKILHFAQQAWSEGDWSGPGGPLEDIHGDGVKGLSIRVIELWEYSVGGGLTDPYHYDTDSIITIVTLISDPEDFEGGNFRTFEVGDSHKTYDTGKGESVAFVSHKYHNITNLVRGCRKSLVMELWQGGVGHKGR